MYFFLANISKNIIKFFLTKHANKNIICALINFDRKILYFCVRLFIILAMIQYNNHATKKEAIMAEAYITLEGKKEKEERLQYLKSVVRPAVLEKLKTAREYGDLSENSEYDAARNEQGRLESEINMIEETLRTAKIVDSSTLSKSEISVGSTVKLFDMDFDEEVEYRIVGAIESDPDRGLISNESPIGKALVGKQVGEIATIVTPGGSIQMKVLAIS